MSKLDEKILISEIKKHRKTKKKLEKKIKQIKTYENHNEFIMKCMFGEINALKGLKGESKKWTDSQLDGMIYILEKHLFTFLDETEVFGVITDEIYEWWKGHKPHDFYVSEYTKELNEINKRLNEFAKRIDKLEMQISNINPLKPTTQTWTSQTGATFSHNNLTNEYINIEATK